MRRIRKKQAELRGKSGSGGDLYNEGVAQDAEETALRERLYQEIGQMKVALDWL